MSDLTDEDQTGFIKGCQTQDNIRRTLHIINAFQKRGTSEALVSLDAKKAFDCVNWTFLYQVLERFGFKKESIKYIRAIYQNQTARIKVNGNLTNKINLKEAHDWVAACRPHFSPCI